MHIERHYVSFQDEDGLQVPFAQKSGGSLAVSTDETGAMSRECHLSTLVGMMYLADVDVRNPESPRCCQMASMCARPAGNACRRQNSLLLVLDRV
jgi:hypothetical protein